MFKKWLKDYNDLLKMKYRRPQRWYDCRNKNPLIIGEQQIPCRSLKCTSFHCNHARTEVDAKIRLAKFFFIKPNICAVIKFKKPPFYLGDFEISLLKSFINEKLNYQRKKYKFHIEYKMELDLKFKAHFHLTIRDDSNKELVISVKIIKKILEKATLGAFSKLCKFLKKPNIIPKIIIYCAEIKNLKKYANYISKRGKHLKKLVVFPEYWDTKKSRISSSTQAFKILKSKEWLDYYFKNRDLIKCWNGNSDCKNITETQSFNDDKKSLQLDKFTKIERKRFPFLNFNKNFNNFSLNILMIVFLTIFSMVLFKFSREDELIINKFLSELQIKINQRKTIHDIFSNLHFGKTNHLDISLNRNRFFQQE